jgi:hypothetical protein
VILFDIAIINWTLSLPQGIGNVIWTGIFTLGVVLIIFSSSFAKMAASTLSKGHVDQVVSWERSGDLVTMVVVLSHDEALRLVGFTRKHFGEYAFKTVTYPNGKTRNVKMSIIGSKLLPGHRDEDRQLLNVILYRRDLASLQGIRRPWRRISQSDGTIEMIRPSRPVQLPKGMVTES